MNKGPTSLRLACPTNSPFHVRFEGVVWLTHALGSVPWWSAILNLVLVTAGFFVIDRLTLAYTQQSALLTFLIVLEASAHWDLLSDH